MSTYHTPPSLSWLIKTRSRQHGRLISVQAELRAQIDQHEKQIADAEESLRQAIAELAEIKRKGEIELSVLKSGLEAIDTTISFHDINIDPNWIKPVRSQRVGRHEAYGVITRGIYSAFNSANGSPLTTTQIAQIIATSEYGNLPDAAFSAFKYRVRKRLSYLCWEGKIRCLHEAKTQSEGRWFLPEQATNS